MATTTSNTGRRESMADLMSQVNAQLDARDARREQRKPVTFLLDRKANASNKSRAMLWGFALALVVVFVAVVI